MISKLSTRSWLKSLVLCSCSTLSMQMLSKVVLWRFHRSNNILCIRPSAIETDLSMCHVEMVNIILLMILLSVVLILKDFGEDAFSVTIDLIPLKRHSSAMNSIKLSFCTSRRSLTSSAISLCDRWSLNFNLCCWSRNEILCLITARLNHKSLIFLTVTFTIRIYGLPCSLWLALSSWICIDSLIHAIHYISLM